MALSDTLKKINTLLTTDLREMVDKIIDDTWAEAHTKFEKMYYTPLKTELELQKEIIEKLKTDLELEDKKTQKLKTDLKLKQEKVEKIKPDLKLLKEIKHEMVKECRTLRNIIQELKGNVRVFCRVRPRTPKETEQMKALCDIRFIGDCTIEIGKSDGSDAKSCSGKSRKKKQEFSSRFSFDKIFAPNASQADVFEELSLLVQSALKGYNVCVFAYGQTGSGKTYTMEGELGSQTEGMIPRTVHYIFEEINNMELLGWEYRIEASFLEIYNEHIVDLLDITPKPHEIQMVPDKDGDLYVTNLKIEEIHSPEELHECLRTVQRNRAAIASTLLHLLQSNERSSKSHSVARIRLIGTHVTKQEESIGNLNLVDLAGSERLETAETNNINKSLVNLGKVILALLKKQEHIPYKNSKLTHLLMPSLGNSKILMLLNVSPLDECYNETLNSLRFASKINNCKTGNGK